MYQMMFPDVSFLALKTHFDPTMFALGGASSMTHVPAVWSVSSSSSIAFSQSSQSGCMWASFSICGLRASASLIMAARAYLVNAVSSLSSPFHSSPLGSPSRIGFVGIWTPWGIAQSVAVPDSMSCTACNGLWVLFGWSGIRGTGAGVAS